MVNAQKMICEAFGYKEPFPPTHEIFKVGKKNEQSIHIVTDNNSELCAMCGKEHPVGYTSQKGTNHLLKSMIPNSFNKCYALTLSNFICEHCGYSIVSYNSPSKMKNGKKIINVFVDSNGYKRMNFNADSKNELYQIIKNPPQPPFVILVNPPGTVLENLVFTAKPTISKGWIVVNYGEYNLEVCPDEVFACIHDARVIAAKLKIEPTADNIFNRQDDIKIKPNSKLVKNEEFLPLLSGFLGKYNRDYRIVAKMILNAYLKEHKEPVELPKDKEISNGQSLFDF